MLDMTVVAARCEAVASPGDRGDRVFGGVLLATHVTAGAGMPYCEIGQHAGADQRHSPFI